MFEKIILKALKINGLSSLLFFKKLKYICTKQILQTKHI